MSNNYKTFIFLLIGIFSISTIVAQTNIASTAALNSELKAKYQEKLNYKKDVYDRTLRFVNNNPESPMRATLLFNLAEMSTEINIGNPSITCDFYQKVLKADDNFLNKDVVLYNIGFYGFKSEIDKRNQARQNNIKLVMNWPDSLRLTEKSLEYVINAYKELTETFTESRYFTEAYYRLGIIYFDLALDAHTPQKYFLKSVEYFDKVTQQENDRLQNYGLFQRAWSYFTMGDFKNAIKDFTAILELINTDSLKIETTFFEADAIENIAFSLIEYDGTDFVQYSKAAAKAQELFHSFVSDTYGKEILSKSISLKLRYNAPMQAVDLYNAYIALYPESIECPSLVDSIITIYKNNPNRTRGGVTAEELIVDQYKRLATEFRADSLWYQTNKENEISNQLQIIKTAYEFLEPKYYNAFATSKTEDDYIQYKELVNNYSKFDAFITEEYTKKINKNIVDFSQELAESSQTPRLYLETIDNINNSIKTYPDIPEIFDYQETKFYNYERIYAILDTTIEQHSFIDTTRNLNLDRMGLDSLFIVAINDYQNFLINYKDEGDQAEKELIKIIYQRAELYFNNGNFDKAFDDFEYVLQFQIDNDIKKVVYSRLAEISQNRNNYDDAERFYREAVKYATSDEKENFNNNILATMQAKAVTLADSADYITAAQEYLRLAKELENVNPDKSIGFIVNAIESYQKAGQNQTAIDLYLEIASRKVSKNEALAAYISAWTITDSLKDWDQSVSLRKQFINKYKESNEAYKIQLQIIGFYEGEQFNDKEKAAEMYMQLHDDTNLDIGEDSRESIFLNAYRIYVELGDENKIVELSLLFEKLYPNHPKANDFLINVAKIYNDRGEDKKFEDLATYLFKKDPTIDLLVKVAADKLKEVNAEVDTFFVAEQYDLMYEKIKEFKELDKHYQAEGLTLPTDAIYDNFEYYNNYATFRDKFHNGIDAVYNDFLAKTPEELIKVNELTEWKRHLIEGAKRIPKLMGSADEDKAKIIALIQEGNQYDLKTVDRTEALYVAAETYYYGAEVVLTQVQKYLDISKQLNNDQMNANPVQQEQYKNTIMNSGNQIRLNFLKKAVQIYNTILTTFSKGKDYSDEWTEKTYNRLVELGIEKPKVYEYYYSNYGWKINKEPITDLSQAQQNFGIWKNVTIASEQVVFDSAYVVTVADTFDTYLKIDFDVEIKPELLNISYAFSLPLEIYINNTLVEKEAEMKKELTIIGNKLSPQYNLFTSKYLVGGENSIVFKIPSDVTKEKPVNFAAEFSLQYDKEALEYHKMTEQFTLYSDYTWMTKKVNSEAVQINEPDTLNNYTEAMNDSTTAVDSTDVWVPANGSNFKFFKSQMYGLENSEAVDIWYPVIDSNNIETVMFKKEIEIPGEVTDATLKCIGQNTITIWINHKLIVENRGIIVDDRLKKIQPFEYEVQQLVPGENTIEIEVIGGKEYKGLIFEMNYRAKKKLTK